jgi:predicted nucleic acid-binding protein
VGEVFVVNASPVITLAKASHLALLTDLAETVLVPAAVVGEVLAGPESDPARRALEGGWGTRVPVSHMPSVVLEWGLGAGEAEVIAVALEGRGRTAVLDDAQGRKCAHALGLPLIGTLGVVLRAKRLGRITSAAEVLRDLQEAGLHLDPQTIALALRRIAGEDWRP